MTGIDAIQENPAPPRVAVVIPCHRVLAANGLGGFASHDHDGFHLGVKRWLLRHEGVAGYG